MTLERIGMLGAGDLERQHRGDFALELRVGVEQFGMNGVVRQAEDLLGHGLP